MRADARAQTRRAYHNIGVLLESEGAFFDNVVQLPIYVVSRESVQPYLYRRTGVFAEIYPDGDYPPNTLLVIEGLVRPEMLVEVTAVAAL